MAENNHEPQQELSPAIRDLHRAFVSLIEEMEAIDWYNQRASLAEDPELKRIILHNRNEEMEHAAMSLEWLRRRLPDLNIRLRKYLFIEGPIVEQEKEENGAAGSASIKEQAVFARRGGSLEIGSLKGEKDDE